MFARPTGGVKSGGVDNRDGDTAPNRPRVRNGNEVPRSVISAPSSVIPAKAGIQVGWAGKQCRSAQPPTPGFPLSRPCQNCPLSLWERVGVREPRGKQAGVNGNEWERQGYWGPSPGLRPPSPRGRGVGFGGAGRSGLRPPSPRGRGAGFGTGRTGLRPPSPRGRGAGFGTGRTGLRPPSPRGRGAFTQPDFAGMTEEGGGLRRKRPGHSGDGTPWYRAGSFRRYVSAPCRSD